MAIKIGQPAPAFEVEDIEGNRYTLESLRGRNILVSFFRDATCPFCNLRVYELTKQYPELEAKGLMMLAFFSSPKERVLKYIGKKPRPFPLIADPDKKIYELYNVRSSLLGLMTSMVIRMPSIFKAVTLGFLPRMSGAITQMPADFLIGPDLKVKGIYYGKDAADHIPLWIVDSFAGKRYKDSIEPAAAPDAIAANGN